MIVSQMQTTSVGFSRFLLILRVKSHAPTNLRMEKKNLGEWVKDVVRPSHGAGREETCAGSRCTVLELRPSAMIPWMFYYASSLFFVSVCFPRILVESRWPHSRCTAPDLHAVRRWIEREVRRVADRIADGHTADSDNDVATVVQDSSAPTASPSMGASSTNGKSSRPSAAIQVPPAI